MSSIESAKMVPRRDVSPMAPQYTEEDIYADLVQQGMDVAGRETREQYLEDPEAMGNDLGVDSPDEAFGVDEDEDSKSYFEPPLANDEKLRSISLD
jgi:hypothetical protein